MQKNIIKKVLENKRGLILTSLAAVAIVGSTLFSSSTDSIAKEVNSIAKTEEEKKELFKLLDLFSTSMELTKNMYVDEVSNKELIEDAINGMLTARDPHSSFLNEEHFKEFNEDNRGEFGGLGIEVTMDKGVVKVISPIDDTPAYDAGVEAGDLITHIDGEQVNGLSLSEAVKKMKGKPGTKVELTIFREGEEPFDLKIKRATIKPAVAKARLQRDDKILYTRISSFNLKTYEELEEHIEEALENKKSKVRGLILDLRNNPGGLLKQAIKVSDAFLEQGEIVSTIARENPKSARNASSTAFATKGDLLNGMPIVVLINTGSASASEIVAGALQDHRRAVIVGTKSYGKGSVQSLMPLMGGKVAVKMTTAKYYTPSGLSIQGEGITPDVEVKWVKDFEETEDKRLFTEGTLRKSLKNDTKSKKSKKKKRKLSKKEEIQAERDAKDYQLQRGLDILEALIVSEDVKDLTTLKAENKKKRLEAKSAKKD
jgi:carboxyl-terminal processing protease